MVEIIQINVLIFLKIKKDHLGTTHFQDAFRDWAYEG